MNHPKVTIAKWKSRFAFTLVELMIVVTIIGILTLIAIPKYMQARLLSQDASFINDIRLLTNNTFLNYSMQTGGFPPDAAPGIEPSGIHDFLPRNFIWEEPPAIGGKWDWDRAVDRLHKTHDCYAGVSISKPDRTEPEMRHIDEILDDGNILEGTFRKRDGGYIYILEK